MNEERRFTSQWTFLRFDDGTATNVRVLRGTTIVEVQIRGRKKLFDLADYLPLQDMPALCERKANLEEKTEV